MSGPTLSLPGGQPMPALGFGTYQLTGDTARQAVGHALEVGYRHIDTAMMYDNHVAVGRGLAEAGVDRAEIFLVTKIWHDRLRRTDLLADAEQALNELGTDYVDQLLIHWPNSRIPIGETLGAMKELHDAGKTRTIGVSNFTVDHLRQARDAGEVPLAANQVECHPYLAQPELHAFCRQHAIAMVAYRPLGRGEVCDDPVLGEIGRKHGRTAAQVALRWLLQRGLAAIPRSSTPRHIEENWQALGFELDDDDRARIDGLDRNQRQIVPDFAEFGGPE